jgi:hypothetical protein
MARIFGRDASPDHPLQAKLAPLDTATTTDRFVAENWRCDWRVALERERVAVSYVCEANAEPLLEGCYRRYHDACICHGNPCEYCGPSNHFNLISGPIRRDTQLCRVVCLNTRAFRESASEQLPRARVGRHWGSWLDAEIDAARRERGILGVRDLLTDLFRAWNNRDGIDDRPVWASFWADVAPLVSRPRWADRLRDALGLGLYESEQWLVLLRYEVKEVGQCYRPTCLDADWQPWHIVSPPGEPTGFAMDLSGAGVCCPEVIHHPIALRIDQWTGDIDRTSTFPGEEGLAVLRTRHYYALRAGFPRAGRDWLPEAAL